jgi:hypothetical protein
MVQAKDDPFTRPKTISIAAVVALSDTLTDSIPVLGSILELERQLRLCTAIMRAMAAQYHVSDVLTLQPGD